MINVRENIGFEFDIKKELIKCEKQINSHNSKSSRFVGLKYNTWGKRKSINNKKT